MNSSHTAAATVELPVLEQQFANHQHQQHEAGPSRTLDLNPGPNGTDDLELMSIPSVVGREAGERDPLLLRDKIISDDAIDGLKRCVLWSVHWRHLHIKSFTPFSFLCLPLCRLVRFCCDHGDKPIPHHLTQTQRIRRGLSGSANPIRRKGHSAKGKGKQLADFYQAQNEHIQGLLKPLAVHTADGQQDEKDMALKVKIAVNLSLGCNILLAGLQLYAAISSLSLALFATCIDSGESLTLRLGGERRSYVTP